MAHKDDQYFDMFVTSAEYSLNAAEKLHDLTTHFPDNQEELKKKMLDLHAIEHAADEHFHKMFHQLSSAFITPIDREDILLMAESIDDLTDAIESVCMHLYMLNVTTMRDDVCPFTELIVKSCKLLVEALKEFSKFKKSDSIFEKILNVSNTEVEGDKLYMASVRNLMTSDLPVLDIIQWREIYLKLETCFDRCETVADNLSGCILKNS